MGRGEHSLRLTCEILTQGGDIHQIPNTLSSDNVISPKIQPLQYSNIDELKFDFTDYFEQIDNTLEKKDIVLPIEGGRGCHWRKCHFVFEYRI